jgi:hypothetical protein
MYKTSIEGNEPMAEFVKKETTVTSSTPSTTGQTEAPTIVEPRVESSQSLNYLIYFFVGLIEVLLAFRFVLRLLGANPVSGFVNLIYSITQILVLPFVGIFRRAVAQGAETTAVLEPETIVAMIVYGLIGWGIVYLATILSRKQPS